MLGLILDTCLFFLKKMLGTMRTYHIITHIVFKLLYGSTHFFERGSIIVVDIKKKKNKPIPDTASFVNVSFATGASANVKRVLLAYYCLL